MIDYLEKNAVVDAGRIGVFGPSMGGYLAPRSAACDTRIKACAFAGGMYDRTRVLNRLEDPFEFARIAHIWKVYDKQKLVELHSRCTLEGLAAKIRCPLLVVHGSNDFVPVEQAKRIYDEASGLKEWLLLEGGNHVCNNMPFRYRPAIGDFLARHLASKTWLIKSVARGVVAGPHSKAFKWPRRVGMATRIVGQSIATILREPEHTHRATGRSPCVLPIPISFDQFGQ